MLYLRNTNQIQSIEFNSGRGPAPILVNSISASYTANSSSLFVLLSQGVTKLSTTSSATTNFTASNGSLISASINGDIQYGFSSSVSLNISASNGSYIFSGSSTGSKIETEFYVNGETTYIISSSFTKTPYEKVTGNGLFRTQYLEYFSGSASFFETAVSSSTGTPNVGQITPGFTASIENRSVQWLGYFEATSSEDYTFFADTDDAMLMWIGPDAIDNYTTASINMGITTRGPIDLTGSVISLVANVQYPMRIQWGDVDGPEFLSMSFSTPTIPKTLDLTNYTFYNTSSNGF